MGRYSRQQMYQYDNLYYMTREAARIAYKTKKWLQSRKSNRKPSRITQRFNEPGLPTMTLTEEKKTMPQTESHSVGIHKSFQKVNTRNAPLKRVVKNSIDYQDTYKYETEWLSSNKVYIEACFVGTKSQYLFANTVNPSMASDSYEAFFNLNPLQGIPTGQITTGSTDPAVDWISISNGVVYMDFINQSNLPCQVKVQWFKARTDGSNFLLDNYRKGVTDNSLYDADQVAGNNGGNETYTYIGASGSNPSTLITDSYSNIMSKRNTTQIWQPVSSKVILLAGGDVHRLTNFITANMFQCKSKLSSHGEDFPKGSLCCVVSYQGLACHFRQEGENAFDGVGLAPGKVGLVITRKLKLKPLKAPNERFDVKYSGQNSTILYGKTVAEAQIIGNNDINIDIGEVLQ